MGGVVRVTLEVVPTPQPATARRLSSLALLLIFCVALSGCSYFRTKAANKYVYVTVKQTVLRDRVAAVSMRTGTTYNGEKLEVLERSRHFLRVRTPRGEIGWIEERLTANQHTADQFEALRAGHDKDPVVAGATARDEVYLHIAPGRETAHFYRLAEGDNLSLLERATVAKQSAPQAAYAPHEAVGKVPEKKSESSKPSHAAADAADTPAPAPPPVLEDWWLVRDAKGQTGWIYSRMIDVTAPDTLARYAEGQRIVGAYVLAHVQDPDSGILNNGVTVTDIPEYVAVLSPYQAGLPYDFDQVRVFVWNIRKHRYETAFREHEIAGYLPVEVGMKKDPYLTTAAAQTPLPSFTYRVLAANAPVPTPDPATGLVTHGHLVTKTYRLEGNICRRLLPPGTPPPAQAHLVPASAKDKSKGKKKHKP
jgi:SH3-like domain-containing protein